MALKPTWLFFVLAKAILELASGGLSPDTRENLQNIVDVSEEDGH